MGFSAETLTRGKVFANLKTADSTKEDDVEFSLLVGVECTKEDGSVETVNLPVTLRLNPKYKAKIIGSGEFQDHLSLQNQLFDELVKRLQSLQPGEEMPLETFHVTGYRRKTRTESQPQTVTFNF